MSLRKEQKLATRSVLRQQEVALELQSLLGAIEKAERTITELKTELEAVNRTHLVRSTTQQDIDFLSALLNCAHKKLGWEKQVASLRKRAPLLMQQLAVVMDDVKNPPDESMCSTLLRAMQLVKEAMDRLEKGLASFS